ncbi:MAG TPA: YtxH domain-containing protein [Allosphingosinicella sp.]|nr:YtxH domain-containing protein [Allosphingosinicella sp.]
MANDNNAPKGRAASALEAARERTASAYEAARTRASDATRKANEQLSVYPISAVVGGFVLGALVGALIPRSERETKLVGKAGRRVAGAARDAAQRGIDAGREQLDQLKTKAAETVSEAVSGFVSKE